MVLTAHVKRILYMPILAYLVVLAVFILDSPYLHVLYAKSDGSGKSSHLRRLA